MKRMFILAILIILFLNLGSFLDIAKKPVKADFIVCLDGGIERIQEAIDLYNYQFSIKDNLLLMGNKHQIKWKIKSQKNINIKNINITYTKSFANTMDELKYIDRYIALKQYKSILIVTDPFHSRRVDFLIKNFTKNLKNHTDYTITSSGLKWWNKYLFFLNRKSFVASISESAKIVYNYFKYSFPDDNTFFKNLDELSCVIKSYTYKNYGIY